MAITSKGIYYPTSSDAVAPLEAVFSTVASSVDAAIPLSGASPLTFTTVGPGSQTTTVPFGRTFSIAPTKVQVTIKGPASGSSPYVATVTNISTTGFTVLIYRLTGTDTEAINIMWSVMS